MPTSTESIDREECRRAANALISAFSWEDSPEGEGYWREVFNKLDDRAITGEWE